MGKDWDHGIPGVPFWEAVKRVLKPGAHLLAFGGTRTFWRLAAAIDEAGFEYRDTLCWLYGSGFPKSLDVSKAIDKAAGAEREVIGHYEGPEGYGRAGKKEHCKPNNWTPSGTTNWGHDITAPATDAARQWDGWGTALKPAWEPIIVARKPLSGTVAANVLEHGTGALNINFASRVPVRIYSFIFSRADLSMTGPTSVPGYSAGPTATLFTLSTSRCRNRSYTGCSTITREQAEHFCPEYPKADCIVP